MTEPLSLDRILREHKGKDGRTLFDHLSSVFEKMMNNQSISGNFYDDFEKISSFIKHNDFNYKDPRPAADVNTQKDYSTHLTAWYNECLATLGKVYKSDEKGNKREVKALGALPDLLNDAQILELASVGFGREETLLLQKSLTQLAARTQAQSLRFWGKILGTERDYYVAEGKLNHSYSDEAPSKDVEPHGTGVNRLTFWVTNNVLDDWYELPLVTPQQLVVSRKIKHIFTGDLNAKINSYPVFPGQEKHYLKAQIVRITFSTSIIPRGLRKLNEEDEKIEELDFEEDVKYPPFEELNNIENWVHFHQNILQAGRMNHLEPNVPEEEKDEIMGKLLETDPMVDRLRAITEDTLEGLKEAWKLRTYGDAQVYSTYNKDEEGTTTYQAVALKSQVWPGAMTIASAKNSVTIYIGYGHKALSVPIQPLQPQDVQDEPDDIEEHFEPNPKNPLPEKPETDTDEPKKEEGDEEEES